MENFTVWCRGKCGSTLGSALNQLLEGICFYKVYIRQVYSMYDGIAPEPPENPVMYFCSAFR